jgi:hypothetical protein
VTSVTVDTSRVCYAFYPRRGQCVVR